MALPFDIEDLASKIRRNSAAEDKHEASNREKDVRGMEDSLKVVKSDSVGDGERAAADEKEKFKKTVTGSTVNEMGRNSGDQGENLAAEEEEKIKRTEDSANDTSRNHSGEENSVLVGKGKAKITVEDDQGFTKNKNKMVSADEGFQPPRSENPRKYSRKENVPGLPFLNEDFQREQGYSSSSAEFPGYNLYFGVYKPEWNDLSSRIGTSSAAESNQGMGDRSKEAKCYSVVEKDTDEKEKSRKTVFGGPAAIPVVKEDFQIEEGYSSSPAEFLGYNLYFEISRMTEPQDFPRRTGRNYVAEDKNVKMSGHEKDRGRMVECSNEVKNDSVNEMATDSADEGEKLATDEEKKIKKTSTNSAAEENLVMADEKMKITSMEDDQSVSEKKTEDSSGVPVDFEKAKITDSSGEAEEKKVVIDDGKVKTTILESPRN